MTSCTVISETAISCVVPPLTRLQPGDTDGLNYTIIMDNAPGPDLSSENLWISVEPNPGNFSLVESEYNTGSSAPIRILVSFRIPQEILLLHHLQGDNLLSVDKDVYNVTVGGESCRIIAVTSMKVCYVYCMHN